MPSNEYIRDLENNRIFHSYGYDEGYKDGYAKGYEDGKIEQEPKVGKWLEKEIHGDKVGEWQSARCSVCDKYHTTPYMYYFSHYEYCPHCGTKMEGRQKVDKGRSKRNSRNIHHTERQP